MSNHYCFVYLKLKKGREGERGRGRKVGRHIFFKVSICWVYWAEPTQSWPCLPRQNMLHLMSPTIPGVFCPLSKNDFGLYFLFCWLLCGLALACRTIHCFAGLFIWKRSYAWLVRSLKDMEIVTLWEGFAIATLYIIEHFITTVKIVIATNWGRKQILFQ